MLISLDYFHLTCYNREGNEGNLFWLEENIYCSGCLMFFRLLEEDYVRRNNRQLHKATVRKGGKRQSNTAPKYVHGFRLFDCVQYQDQRCFVFGRRSSGYFDLRTLNGTKVSASANYKKLAMVQKASALLVERRAAFPSTP